MRPDVQRLELLTLAAEDAVRHGAWDELACLLVERNSILDALETHAPSDLELRALQRALEADAKLAQSLADARTDTVDAIARAQNGRRLAAVYAPQNRTPLTDRTG